MLVFEVNESFRRREVMKGTTQSGSNEIYEYAVTRYD
jgi:hypothetical protein